MKKLFIGLLLGFIIHMLYIDYLMAVNMKEKDSCIVRLDNPTKEGDDGVIQKCWDQSDYKMGHSKLKAFGLFYLLHYQRMHVGNWEME